MTRRYAALALASSIALSGAAACGGAPLLTPVPPVTSALPGPGTLPPAPSGSEGAEASAAAAPPAYSGHGVETIAPEVLAKYRPGALSPEVSRRIQSLMDVRAPGPGILAPDGKALFFPWSITGIGQIWKVDGPRHFPQQVTGGEDSTSLMAITADGRWLVIQRDRKGEENPGLYLQPAGGGPLDVIQHLPGVQTRFEGISGDSRYVYFTSNDRKPDSYVVYRWDVAAKKREVVFDAQDGLWRVSDLQDDGRLLLRKETGSVTAEYSEWDPAKHVLTPLIGQGETEEYDARYGAHEGELVVLTNKLGEFRRLYSFRVPKAATDGKAGKLVPLGDDIKFDVDAFAIDHKRTHVLYTVNEGGFTRLHALDAATLRPATLPAFPDTDHVYFGDTTPDGRYTTLGVDDGRHPLRGLVLDWSTGKAEPWHTPSTPEIDTTRFARVEIASYPARDGTKIPVLVRRPELTRCGAQTPCPVVVSFHGGPESQARPGFSVGPQMFVDAGFVYVEPNVRGSDGYGKTWLHADDGPRRLAVITDIEDAGKWARAHFAVGGREPKVGIFGGSYGGYSVLMGMTMFAGAYDAGVDVVGISDLRTFLKNTAPYRRLLRISEYGDPDRDADALAKLSPMTYVDKTKAPLLIMQGASDPRVPAGEAIQIHDALAQRGVPCTLMIFPDEGHGAQKRENRVLMLGGSVAFFQDHLAGVR
ncbi:MAG TPA: prolyl oligopeptidase family serine peptidase [Polyangiaceae bacterium]|jgi:dipeptidyl aminopeptidase/acylaminoacyl peptidase|nr:prolyl oligopeptidase family serine peptidase [Polyangiaceae bacterium]